MATEQTPEWVKEWEANKPVERVIPSKELQRKMNGSIPETKDNQDGTSKVS